MHSNRLIEPAVCLSYLLHGLHGVFNLMNSALWAPDGHVIVILVAILEERGGGGKQHHKQVESLLVKAKRRDFVYCSIAHYLRVL